MNMVFFGLTCRQNIFSRFLRSLYPNLLLFPIITKLELFPTCLLMFPQVLTLFTKFDICLLTINVNIIWNPKMQVQMLRWSLTRTQKTSHQRTLNQRWRRERPQLLSTFKRRRSRFGLSQLLRRGPNWPSARLPPQSHHPSRCLEQLPRDQKMMMIRCGTILH